MSLTPHELLLLRRRAQERLADFAGFIELPDRQLDETGDQFSAVQGALAAHHRVVCDAVQRCVEKPYGRLMILAPPGAAKSTYTSVVAPPWIMGRWPKKRIILASYASEIAEKQSKKARAICRSQRYQTLFDTSIPSDSRAADEWALTNGSQFMCGGILSGLTGNRGDCFPAGTAVRTPAGSVPIESLGIGDDVLSFDHSNKCYTTSKVVATREIERNGFVKVTTSQGRSFVCTADHRVFTRELGYREAQLLEPGSTLVRAPEGSGEHDMQGVLQRSKAVHGGRTDLHRLQQADDAEALRLHEADCARCKAVLLRTTVQSGTPTESCGVNQQLPMQDVRREGQEGQLVLQPHMLAGEENQAEKVSGHPVPAVQQDVLASEQPSTVLQSAVLVCSPLDADDGRGEFPLQGWGQLRRVVPADEACDPGKGWRGVRGVQASARNDSARARSPEVDTCDSPLRREPSQQRGMEPDRHVSAVPHETPQVAYDTVSMVERVGAGAIKVYDIQVEATECFFAEEILVHNCVIGDDLIKGRNEAESETIRTRTWEAFRDDFRTRLVSGGSMILMNTRWHQQDISGMILPVGWDGESGEFEGSDGLVWEVVSLPAKIETELQERTDPIGRKMGEYLWPEYWGLPHWKQSDPALGARDTNTPTGRRAWYSMYQQNPHPDDGILFQREDFRWYEPDELPSRLRMYAAGDWALTDELLKPDPDWTEIGVGGWDDGNNEDGAPRLYFTEWYSARKDVDVTVPHVAQMFKRLRNRLRAYFGEQGNIETLVWPLMVREARDKKIVLPHRVLLPTAGQGNKVMKAAGFKKLVEENRVWLPVGAAWAEKLVEQCCGFPGLAHDDMVDVGSIFGRAQDQMLNAPGAVRPEEREPVLTPLTYEWHERMMRDEAAEKARLREEFE